MANNLVEYLLDRNKKQSEEFSSPAQVLSRLKYRAMHQTEIAVLKCMDGRLDLSVITRAPAGIVQPFRNIGGKFSMGWSYFAELMNNWVNYSVRRGRDCMVLVTYHFSKGDKHRGCRGFDYDTEEAKAYTQKLRDQITRVFGPTSLVVYALQVGIETDEDGLVVHGSNGQVLDISAETETSEDAMRVKVGKIFPDMKAQMINDLLPLLMGNIEHIKWVRSSNRPIAEVDHKEQVLAVGRGFSWLHKANFALITGPYGYKLGQTLVTAAGILLSNLKDGRSPWDDGLVLLVSDVYFEEVGPEKAIAQEKAISLANFCWETIQEGVPELNGHMKPLVGIVNAKTRLFTRLPFTPK